MNQLSSVMLARVGKIRGPGALNRRHAGDVGFVADFENSGSGMAPEMISGDEASGFASTPAQP